MKPFDVVVVGEINPDLILRGNAVPEFGQVEKLVSTVEMTIGSSACIFACGAARLGLRVQFIGKVGDDDFGRFMLRSLQERQIDTSACVTDPSVQTGLTVILVEGNDRAILTHTGSIAALRFAEIDPDRLAQARHLHLTSYFIQSALRPDVSALFDLAHRRGLSVSLDTNYDPAEEWNGGLWDVLSRVDVFLPNQTECCAIARLPDLPAATDKLSACVDVLAVKLGKNGATARHGSMAFQVASLPVDVVDTVGAGDSFDAGFVYGFLAGWELSRALRLGAVCGSLSTRQAGGTAAQPTLAEASKYLKE